MNPPKHILVLIGTALALAGCGRHAERTVAPRAKLPPDVVAVSPPSRATGVFYDTEIWADFAQPLDPATVNDRSVFLKIDTRRFPVEVSYDTLARRIRLIPEERLQLRQTYTVELTSIIATKEGARFDDTYFWEFTTNSLRRVENPFPASGATARSPFTPLTWSGTEASAGTIDYALYIGADSAQIANQAGSTRVARIPSMLANPPWPMGARLFWSLVARNGATREEQIGPVWSFSTLDPGAQTDSLVVSVSQYGSYRLEGDLLSCNSIGLQLGRDGFNSGVRWNFEALPSDLQLVDAMVELYTYRRTTDADQRRPLAWAIQDDWTSCVIGYPGPPYTEYAYGPLAVGVETIMRDTTWYRMRSDALTSHMQGVINGGNLYGYTLTAMNNYTSLYYLSSNSLRLYYYK